MTKSKKKIYRKKFNAQIITAVAVTVISLCALFVSIYQTRIFAEQQKLITKAEKAQLWPNLMVNYRGFNNGLNYSSIGFSIINKGVGPAIIEGFEIVYKNEKMDSWISILESDLSEHDLRQFQEFSTYTNFIPFKKQVIPAGESIELFRIDSKDPTKTSKAFLPFEGSIQPQIKIIYSSVFEDKWLIKTKFQSFNSIPEKISF